MISSRTNSTPDTLSKTDHLHGSPDAKVAVIEYGDFECPSCLQAYPGVKMMLKRFGDRICFAFRHYPLTQHSHAEMAAEAAEAAAAQHKFWPMHDLLFDNQQHLKANNLRQYAQKLELDLERYDWDMKEHTYLQRVQEHLRSGQQSGVHGTPAFFVNCAVTDVSFGMQHLEEAIEKALKG